MKKDNCDWCNKSFYTEKVADDYAIEFLDWYGGLRLDQVDGKKTKKLLKIFKKEKGL